MNKDMKRVLIQGIGNFSILEQYKILECLLDKGDRFLFHRFNTKLSEITPCQLLNLKNEIFEDFCDGILFFEQGNKEMLISNIINILSLCNIKYKCESSTELLLSKLLNQDKEVMNWVETDDIKQMIFEMYNFNNDDIDKKWIENRIVFENNYVIDETGILNDCTSHIWYSPQNSIEVMQSMEMEVHYSGIVLKDNHDFINYSYAFYCHETADNYDLIIFDNYKCFYNYVIPKILKYDKKIIELIKDI